MTAALNHESIRKNPHGISPFSINIIGKKWISCQKHKKCEIKNKLVALNASFAPNNEEEIKQGYILKHSSECTNEVIPLIITGGERWHYLAV